MKSIQTFIKYQQNNPKLKQCIKNLSLFETKEILGIKDDYIQDIINQEIKQPFDDLQKRHSKYMRPLMIISSAELLQIPQDDYLFYSCALIENIHNNTLIIDDIQDKSEKRRGDKAIHIKYGIDTSLNTSLFYINYLMNNFIKLNCITSESQQLQIMNLYNKVLQDLYMGVTMDVFWHKKINLDNLPNQYQFELMLKLKTSRLIVFGLELLELREKNQDYQIVKSVLENFGICFQINDDLVNLFNEQFQQSKGFAEDLHEKKLSFLVLDYLKNGKNKQEFYEIFMKDNKDIQDIEFLKSQILQSGGQQRGLERMDELQKVCSDKLGKFGNSKLIEIINLILKNEVKRVQLIMYKELQFLIGFINMI